MGEREAGPSIARTVAWIEQTGRAVKERLERRLREWDEELPQSIEESSSQPVDSLGRQNVWYTIEYQLEVLSIHAKHRKALFRDLSLVLPPFVRSVAFSLCMRTHVVFSEAVSLRKRERQLREELADYRDGRALLGNLPSIGETMDMLTKQVHRLSEKLARERREKEMLQDTRATGELELLEHLVQESERLCELKRAVEGERRGEKGGYFVRGIAEEEPRDLREEERARLSDIEGDLEENKWKLRKLFERIQKSTQHALKGEALQFFLAWSQQRSAAVMQQGAPLSPLSPERRMPSSKLKHSSSTPHLQDNLGDFLKADRKAKRKVKQSPVILPPLQSDKQYVNSKLKP
jgi:hypothetical protein